MRRVIRKISAIVLSGMLFGGVAGTAFVGVAHVGNIWSSDINLESQMEEHRNPQTQTSTITTNTNSSVSDNRENLDVVDITNLTMPSIVAITNKSVQEVQSYFQMFGFRNNGMQQEVESSGSGIIIGKNDSELLLATNNHVVEDAVTLSVCFVDGQVYNAYIKGTDAENDLAVIAVKLADIGEDTLSKIEIIQIGDSDALQVGEQVVAIGNALGYGQSVTTGIVSAVNRQIGDSENENGFIQTDAAINPGNSGGALLNMKGELIGINSAKLADTKIEGMGYAIPVNLASPIIKELMNQEVRTKVEADKAGSMGISGQTVDASISQAYGIPAGVYVAFVEEGSGAWNAGLQKGSVITKFDNRTVQSLEELKEVLGYYEAGETVTITVKIANHGEYVEKELSLTLDTIANVEK